MTFLEKIKYYYIVNHLEKNLESKFFNLLSLFTAIACSSTAFVNISIGLTPWLNVCLLSFSGVCILLFGLSFVKGITRGLKLPFLAGITTVVVFSWISNQGIEGSTTCLLLSFLIVNLYLFESRYSILVFVSFLFLLIGLLYIQFFYPEVIQKYPSRDILIKDVTVGCIVSIGCIGVIILLLKWAELQERRRINMQKEVFEQMNEELKMQMELNQQQSEEITCTLEEIKYHKQLVESQNQQLERKNEELRELNATKDKFLSIIGHDLKNPISAIIGFTELLSANAQQYDKAKIEHFSHIIADSSKHVFDLLENLLAWARCQTGNIQFKPTEVAIDDLVAKSIQLLSEFAQRKDISIVLTSQSKAKVLCDPNMINTVVRNLISNAIKFTPAGGLIEISSKQQNGQVFISVTDNGVGMTPEQVEKLFLLGEQISTSGTNNEPGTGLGLFLSKDFLTMHNSTLTVHSTKDVGTVFGFALKMVN